ncbi:uncharacterized protein BXZ73DRAFT_73366 [Epithele typhae]|uniref:uncharacterized protein n=1 Tax=Epithele typhae TaxID=378194 RepID=UPI0020083794|nr:uncharacterized protein BXZ73DRAFT_73366 [Epithele typhae]KAH9945179.1 hypothetical protein BXZ73DRAFT_73366 [Epithele typhae]
MSSSPSKTAYDLLTEINSIGHVPKLLQDNNAVSAIASPSPVRAFATASAVIKWGKEVDNAEDVDWKPKLSPQEKVAMIFASKGWPLGRERLPAERIPLPPSPLPPSPVGAAATVSAKEEENPRLSFSPLPFVAYTPGFLGLRNVRSPSPWTMMGSPLSCSTTSFPGSPDPSELPPPPPSWLPLSKQDELPALNLSDVRVIEDVQSDAYSTIGWTPRHQPGQIPLERSPLARSETASSVSSSCFMGSLLLNPDMDSAYFPESKLPLAARAPGYGRPRKGNGASYSPGDWSVPQGQDGLWSYTRDSFAGSPTTGRVL